MNRHLFKLIVNNISKSFKTFHTSSIVGADLVKTIEYNGIREIILNDPKRRNALSFDMMTELHEAITKNLNDSTLRVIVISAETNVPESNSEDANSSTEHELETSSESNADQKLAGFTAVEPQSAYSAELKLSEGIFKTKSTEADKAKSILSQPNIIFSHERESEISPEPTNLIFSAGHDLKELTEEKGSESHKKLFAKLTEIIMTIREAPVPVLAKVDGQTIGAGCQLVASCDILVCSERTTFSLAATDFGLFASTPAVAISRVMTRMKSAHLLISGLPMSATEANIAGLVSCVSQTEKLDDEVKEICCSILRKSRAVIKLGKEFYYKQLGMNNIQDAYEAAEKVMIENLATNDGKEGVRSFIEKRDPKWNNS